MRDISIQSDCKMQRGCVRKERRRSHWKIRMDMGSLRKIEGIAWQRATRTLSSWLVRFRFGGGAHTFSVRRNQVHRNSGLLAVRATRAGLPAALPGAFARGDTVGGWGLSLHFNFLFGFHFRLLPNCRPELQALVGLAPAGRFVSYSCPCVRPWQHSKTVPSQFLASS